MRRRLLHLLECPFCGTPLTLVESPATRITSDVIDAGVLGCECCAYPIVEGMAVIRADDFARSLLDALDRADFDLARSRLLGVEPDVAAELAARMGRKELGYGDAIRALSPGDEGTYFEYRFSDPTFYLAEGLLQVLLARPELRGGQIVDLCGGSGHLTRVMSQCLVGDLGPPPIVADYFPWKLWLATHVVAPRAEAVCIDANSPLPFAPASCSLVFCADAFEYIWNRRLLAEEMYRLLSDPGVMAITHAHNPHVDNPSMGMPLSAQAYLHLGRRIAAHVFGDDALRAALLASGRLELTRQPGVGELANEASFTVIGVKGTDEYRRGIFASHQRVVPPVVGGEWRLNPLYRAAVEDGTLRLVLSFPSPFYEAEFGGCRAYLPETLELSAEELRDLDALRRVRPDLVKRRVLLNLPVGYLPRPSVR